MYEDIEIQIHCPGCDMEMDVKLSQIAAEECISCPGCGKQIQLKPDAPSSPD